MLAPPADGRTPWGGDAWRELKQYGTVFHHCNVLPGQWGAAGEARIDRMLARSRSAETGLLCAVAYVTTGTYTVNCNGTGNITRIVTRPDGSTAPAMDD